MRKEIIETILRRHVPPLTTPQSEALAVEITDLVNAEVEAAKKAALEAKK